MKCDTVEHHTSERPLSARCVSTQSRRNARSARYVERTSLHKQLAGSSSGGGTENLYPACYTSLLPARNEKGTEWKKHCSARCNVYTLQRDRIGSLGIKVQYRCASIAATLPDARGSSRSVKQETYKAALGRDTLAPRAHARRYRHRSPAADVDAPIWLSGRKPGES